MGTLLCIQCGREAADSTGLPAGEALCWRCIDRMRGQRMREPVPPLIQGGQGREADELVSSGWAILGLLLMGLGWGILALIYYLLM